MNAAYRLRATSDFRRVYASRRRQDGRLLVLHAADGDAGHPRVGLSVSAKVGNAVLRNRVRRRLREACRPLIQGSSNPVDLVVVARPDAASATFAELDAELRELTGKLVSL